MNEEMDEEILLILQENAVLVSFSITYPACISCCKARGLCQATSLGRPTKGTKIGRMPRIHVFRSLISEL